MSSKPSPSGVGEVLALLERQEARIAEIFKLRPLVGQLKIVEEQYEVEERRLRELMESMDVESVGNYGHGARLSWFLRELLRQAKAPR